MPEHELVIDRTWNGAHAEPGERLSVRLQTSASELRICIDAPFHDDPAPPMPRGTCPTLWEYETVELFVAGAGEGYLELEFGPHGHHLALCFSAVRQRVVGVEPPIAYDVARAGSRWLGMAILSRTLLPGGPHRFNAYALHGTGSARRYLAWSPVPSTSPDFHQPKYFQRLELAQKCCQQ